MTPTLVDLETHVVIQDERHYTIHLYDSPYTGEHATEELKAFVDSLHVL